MENKIKDKIRGKMKDKMFEEVFQKEIGILADTQNAKVQITSPDSDIKGAMRMILVKFAHFESKMLRELSQSSDSDITDEIATQRLEITLVGLAEMANRLKIKF